MADNTNEVDKASYANSDDALAQVLQLMNRINDASESEIKEIPPPPILTESSLSDTLRRSATDVFLLGFFALVFTVIAFLKFFRTDI